MWPYSWQHVEGYEQEVEYRKAKLELLREAGHLFMPFEQRIDVSSQLSVMSSAATHQACACCQAAPLLCSKTPAWL